MLRVNVPLLTFIIHMHLVCVILLFWSVWGDGYASSLNLPRTVVFMDNQNYNRLWSVLGWNIRGINAEEKQLKVREKMEESKCAVLCLQETKKESFDRKFIKGFCPCRFDNFAYSPSVGASGGILVVWNSSIFSGQLIEVQIFGIIIKFTSTHSNQQWTLVTLYGPCQGEERDNFVQWLYNLNVPDDEDWLFMGDFNFIRSTDNRNLPGGNANDIFLFNEIISHLA